MKNFNIQTDLQEGDIVKRIIDNNANIHFVDQEYEFLKYTRYNCIVTKCHPEEGEGGYADKFVFVRRPEKSKKVICTYQEAIEALINGACESIFDKNHELFRYNTVDERVYNKMGNSPKIPSILGEWYYIKEDKRSAIFGDEFIEAMKTLLLKYIDGEKKTDRFEDCELCKTLAKVKGIDIDDFRHTDLTEEYCEFCPWVVITGKTCMNQTEDGYVSPDPIERSKELIDWLNEYRNMRK